MFKTIKSILSDYFTASFKAIKKQNGIFFLHLDEGMKDFAKHIKSINIQSLVDGPNVYSTGNISFVRGLVRILVDSWFCRLPRMSDIVLQFLCQ